MRRMTTTSSPNGNPYASALKSATLTTCLDKIIEIGNFGSALQLGQRIADMTAGFDPQTVVRWHTTGHFFERDRRHLPYLETILGIKPDTHVQDDFYTIFSHEFKGPTKLADFINRWAKALENEWNITPSKGFIADTLRTAIYDQWYITPEEYAAKTGIPLPEMQEYLAGTKLIANDHFDIICEDINPKAHAGIKAFLETLLQADIERLIDKADRERVRKERETARPAPKFSSFSHFFQLFRQNKTLSIKDIAIATGTFEGFWTAVEKGLFVPGDEIMERFRSEYKIPKDSRVHNLMIKLVNVDRQKIKEDALRAGRTKRSKLINALSTVDINTSLTGFLDVFVDASTKPTPYFYTTTEIAAAAGMKTRDLSGAMTSERKRGKANYSIKEASKQFVGKVNVAVAKIACDGSEELAETVRTTILNIAFNEIPKKPFSKIVDEYFVIAKREDPPCFHNFSVYWAKCWGMSTEKLVKALDVKIFNLCHGALTKPSPKEIGDSFDRILAAVGRIEGQEVDAATKAKARLIRFGNLELGSLEELTNHALDILSCERPTMARFAYSNPVADYMMAQMPSQKFSAYGMLDKKLVPNALLAVIFEATGSSLKNLMDGAKIGFNTSREKNVTERILNGELPFVISLTGEEAGRCAPSRDPYAKQSGEYLGKDNTELANKLTAAFLGHPQYYQPTQLLDMLAEEKIDIGQLIYTLRVQSGATLSDWAHVIRPEEAYPAIIQRLEKGHHMEDPREAKRLANHIQLLYPSDKCEKRLAAALSGIISRITIEDLNREIEYAYNNDKGKLKITEYSQPDIENPAFVLPVHKMIMLRHQKDILKDKTAITTRRPKTAAELYEMMVEVKCGIRHGSHGKFADSVKYVDPESGRTVRGIPAMYVGGLRKGVRSINCMERSVAVAETAGLDKEHAEMFAKIAAGKSPFYDPDIIEALIKRFGKKEADLADFTMEERSSLIKQLRENARLAKADVWSRTEQSEMSYKLIEERGYVRDNDSTRDSKIADLLEAFIPDRYPTHREFLEKMLTTTPKVLAASISVQENEEVTF